MSRQTFSINIGTALDEAYRRGEIPIEEYARRKREEIEKALMEELDLVRGGRNAQNN